MVSHGQPMRTTMQLEVVQACGLLAAVNAAEEWTDGVSLNILPRVQLTVRKKTAERIADGLYRCCKGLMPQICLYVSEGTSQATSICSIPINVVLCILLYSTNERKAATCAEDRQFHAGSSMLKRAKLHGPTAYACLALSPSRKGMGSLPSMTTAAQGPSFCPTFSAEQQTDVILDCNSMKTLAMQVLYYFSKYDMCVRLLLPHLRKLSSAKCRGHSWTVRSATIPTNKNQQSAR